ncbi:MAG: CDP-diacylglycerol--serine O-phosphatidyltransferase [Candidatus Kapaibacterium sp.]|nr:MAG: CDP-diacylglycerol--serine O-phosphatidyltransferase [Candidatus Kapabacteria bacterium]
MALRVTRSIIPNLFTLGNLFSGFLAIIHFAKGTSDSQALITGAFYVLAAAIFDMLDGIMARLTRSSSEIGVELDSLCDVVSFGVAPSLLLYVAHYHAFGPAGMLLAALPAMAGAYRLARFNVQLTSLEDKLYFRGLPIPAGALTVVTFVIFYLLPERIPTDWRSGATNFVTITTALAMVSTIRYNNLPRPTLRSFRQRPLFSAAVVVAVVLVIATGGSLAFPIMLVYILSGAISHTVSIFQRWRKDRFDFDDFED